MTEQAWMRANQDYLAQSLAAVREALLRHGSGEAPAAESSGVAPVTEDISPPAALQHLCGVFALSPFERDVLLLCAGMELDGAFAGLCASAQGDAARAYPTFSLALAALPGAHWSAITPASPLRYWRLIEVGGGSTLTQSPLRIDERVLNFLVGVQHIDERLAGLVDNFGSQAEEAPSASHRELAGHIVNLWTHAVPDAVPAVVQLCGVSPVDKRAVAADACYKMGFELKVMRAEALPVSALELEGVVRLWRREAALSAAALLLDCDDVDSNDAARSAAIDRVVEQMSGHLILTARERRSGLHRPSVVFEVYRPTPAEQDDLWREALGSAANAANWMLDDIVSQFSLSAPDIRAVSLEAVRTAGHGPSGDPPEQIGDIIWAACRDQSRPRLEELARRIDTKAAWDDLVLPEAQRDMLREIAIHVRQRSKVYERWGFAAKYSRGLGVSALFAGASGTGKTMAAEVLANELKLDLYHIDLSQVVSKYIGETEKNLGRLFDAAEAGGAILLFDEADALFGKRSEVKDSHDRYANLEVSYLLQRMEQYQGLAILTTNMKDSLDPAFLRRLRFVVQFPFPDVVQRADIWSRVFPAKTEVTKLNLERLSKLTLAGGNIRNVALGAAFLAANSGEKVGMKHLAAAARGEYMKLEKPMSEIEVGAWN